MTIEFVVGDLFEQDVEGFGHGVNCAGVMGSGIAPLFRRRWPDMYVEYKALCDRGTLTPGLVHAWYSPALADTTVIYNIASQFNPGADAKRSWLKRGLRAVRLHAETHAVYSVALPRIGAGIGGLDWEEVKTDMIDVLLGSTVHFKIVSLPD